MVLFTNAVTKLYWFLVYPANQTTDGNPRKAYIKSDRKQYNYTKKKIYSIYKLMMWELLFHLHVFLHLLRTQEEFWADLVGQPDK